jgi:phosphopantothenoylcysteine decarboxylase/phosphopantothenate--cysteine ligase
MKNLPPASVFIGTAAVADYRPVHQSAQKVKKTENSLNLELERTPDILSAVANRNQRNFSLSDSRRRLQTCSLMRVKS